MKKYRNTVFLFILILLVPVITTSIDYGLALLDKRPIFVIKTAMYKDGGTSVYKGLFYKVIDYNELEGRQDVVFKSKFLTKGESDLAN